MVTNPCLHIAENASFVQQIAIADVRSAKITDKHIVLDMVLHADKVTSMRRWFSLNSETFLQYKGTSGELQKLKLLSANGIPVNPYWAYIYLSKDRLFQLFFERPAKPLLFVDLIEHEIKKKHSLNLEAIFLSV